MINGFFTVCIAITLMLALACIAHLKDELNKINIRLSDMKFMVNAYAKRTDRVLINDQDIIDITKDALNINQRIIEHVKVLENCIRKEESSSVLRENDI